MIIPQHHLANELLGHANKSQRLSYYNVLLSLLYIVQLAFKYRINSNIDNKIINGV
jgi:hypothetical protein